MHFILCVLLFLPSVIWTTDPEKIAKACEATISPFSYPLNIHIRNGWCLDEPLLICCHGYGSSAILGDILRTNPQIRGPILSFDFPDHDILARGYDPKDSTFGTIQEILPLLYILKLCVVEAEADRVVLYGFSAGGGAAVNAIAALNTDRFDADMQKIGLGPEGKKAILRSIQNGLVILDCPLKSVDEILETRTEASCFDILAERYRLNNMRPIDALQAFAGLTLNVIVYFEMPDQILSNRDDALFIRRLIQNNPRGKNVPVVGTSGGHNEFHPLLWQAYAQFLANPSAF